MARPRGHAGVLFPKLYFDMEPDEEEIRTDLLLLQKRMGDYNLPLQHSKQIIIGDVTKAFTRETDPITGRKWPELSNRAAKVPRDGMLRRRQTNARMFRDMTNRFNYGVSKDGVYLNQSRIVDYMPLHQQDEGATGAGIVKVNRTQFMKDVAEEIVKLKKSRAYEGRHNRGELIKEDAITKISDLAKAGVEGGAAGGRIPQRRFLGPSPEARNKMVGTFDDWAKDVIIIYKRGKNIISAPRRGIS